jgi:hypothetical protein
MRRTFLVVYRGNKLFISRSNPYISSLRPIFSPFTAEETDEKTEER